MRFSVWAGVNYRIMQFIKEHESEAASIHMAYLTKVTGQEFSDKDAKVIYPAWTPFSLLKSRSLGFTTPRIPFIINM